jgi:hypothetical protein
MKPSSWDVIALAQLIPALHAVPLPTREICTCEPIPPFSHHSTEAYNNSLASCNRIARDIERWQFPVHRSAVQGAFVDAFPLDVLDQPGDYSSLDDTAHVTSIYLKNTPQPQGEKTKSRHESRGTYIEGQQQFHILCHPRSPSAEEMGRHLLHNLLSSYVGMILVWLLAFELIVCFALRY